MHIAAIILTILSFVLAFAPLFYVMYRMAFGKEIARFALTPTPKGEQTLTITKQGYYAIWVQGKLLPAPNTVNFLCVCMTV